MSTTTLTPITVPGAVRASDAERDDAVRRIHEALGEGRLDHTEADERSTAAAEAKDRDALTRLLADLPPSGGSPAGRLTADDVPAWTSIREALVWRAHLVVWGPASGRPTQRQCRTATVAVAVAVAVFLLCAVLGALVVGA